jgi:hypothetical protein
VSVNIIDKPSFPWKVTTDQPTNKLYNNLNQIKSLKVTLATGLTGVEGKVLICLNHTIGVARFSAEKSATIFINEKKKNKRKKIMRGAIRLRSLRELATQSNTQTVFGFRFLLAN